METSDYIAIISIIVTVLLSVIGSIHKIVTSTKKFELTEKYTKELLDWYGRTIFTIKKSRLQAMIPIKNYSLQNYQR